MPASISSGTCITTEIPPVTKEGINFDRDSTYMEKNNNNLNQFQRQLY